MKTLLYGLLVTINPVSGWQKIADHAAGLLPVLLLHTLPYALTPESALPMCAMFFLAMVGGVIFLGYMVHWMAESYGTASTVGQGVTLITYTASPFFIAGLLGLRPVLWLDIMLGCLVACYCIYLLYRGTSIVLKVPPERGFLYASAVFAVALVSFVALLGATVVLWDFGPAPEYTY